MIESKKKLILSINKKINSSVEKINSVAKLVRKLRVDKAMIQLLFNRRKVAIKLRDLLKSALANARNNYHLNIRSLVVYKINIGKAVTKKKSRFRAKGKLNIIKKYNSIVTIILKKIDNK